ncbi:MAG TPA: GIY-YIG nuclease family protein, partial [Aquella sp.]|nr:GIY-YIG nuclease family protein [Aquella sp.]
RVDLRNSGYPSSFIEYHVQKALDKFQNPRYTRLPCVLGPDPENSNNSVKLGKFISFPYIEGTESVVKKVFHKYNINIGFKPGMKLMSQLNAHKTKQSKDKRGGNIYQINCKDCNKYYIGETGRELKSRIQEHNRALNKNNKDYAVVEHKIVNNHAIDINEPIILGNYQNWYKRIWAEAIYIHANNKHLMNKNIGKRTISHIWDIKLKSLVKK